MTSFKEFFLSEEAISLDYLEGKYSIIQDKYNDDKRWYFDQFNAKGFRITQAVKGQITGKDYMNYEAGRKFISGMSVQAKDITHSDVLYTHNLIDRALLK